MLKSANGKRPYNKESANNFNCWGRLSIFGDKGEGDSVPKKSHRGSANCLKANIPARNTNLIGINAEQSTFLGKILKADNWDSFQEYKVK